MSFDKDIYPSLPLLTAGAVGLGGSILLPLLVGKMIGSDKKLSPKQIKSIAKTVGAKKTPHHLESTLENNAFFAPKYTIDETFRTGKKDGTFDNRLLLKKVLYNRAKKHGIVVLPKSHGVEPEVVAHEYGHAKDINENDRPMWPYALGLGLSGLGGLAAGLLTSSSLGQKDRSSDWSGKGWGLGTLAGVGTGLALASPALYYEYQASKNADKWVGKDKDKWKRRGRLGAAFGSYLAAATVPGIVGAALGSMK